MNYKTQDLIDIKHFQKFQNSSHYRPNYIRLLCIILLLFVSLFMISCNIKDPLTQEERQWLSEHDGKIIVNNEAGWPPIIDIDEKGLAQISQTEKDDIYRKWISLGNSPFYKSCIFWIIFFSILAIATTFFLFILIWNKSLKKKIKIRTEKLEKINAQLNKEIEQRKQVEHSLLNSEKKYRAILESMEDPTYICSSDLKIEYMNQAMVDLLGEDSTGKLCYDAIFGFDERCPYCVCSKILEGKKVNGFVSVELRDKIFHVSNSLINHEDGRISKLTVYRDITEIKVMENRLQQAYKMEAIGTLAGGIAHDFNNILFPIVGHTEMLLEDFPENNSIRNSLNQIYTSAMRARELVKQILTFSRQEKNELKLIKIQPIVKEALKMIRSTIPTTISIHHNLESNCGAVKADPTQIHQIVMNLATNSYHAMEQNGGELKVLLRELELEKDELTAMDMPSGTYACLTISDTGIGMSKSVLKKIFHPFFTTKKNGKGTGMGLSVVHGIVKTMNGGVKVYSEPGKGTEVRVYLPVVKNASQHNLNGIKAPLPRGHERILLVDDEEAIISMEKMVLERLGYKVTSRTSSIEALEAFRVGSDRYDMVITDMAMPKMPGDKLAAELIKIREDIPVILCTGFSETMTEEQLAALGIAGLLLKPIISKDLAEKIREILDREQTGSENK